MEKSIFSDVLNAVFYFVRMIVIICGICAIIAAGVAYFYSTKGHSFDEVFVSALLPLGLILLLLGGLSIASGPGSRMARTEVSRTHVQGLQAMRGEGNPLFGPGLSLFISGIILLVLYEYASHQV